jgi:hypothetical protein
LQKLFLPAEVLGPTGLVPITGIIGANTAPGRLGLRKLGIDAFKLTLSFGFSQCSDTSDVGGEADIVRAVSICSD